MCDVLDRVEARGIAIGEERGEKRGEKRGERRLSALIMALISAGRGSEVERAASDEKYREKLFIEFHIL